VTLSHVVYLSWVGKNLLVSNLIILLCLMILLITLHLPL